MMSVLTAAALAALLVSPPASANDTAYFFQDAYECQAQPGLPWCLNTRAAPAYAAPKASSELLSLSAHVEATFRYRLDRIDTWRSYATRALDMRIWHGDCDDLVSTVIDVFDRYGVPRERMWRVQVARDGSEKVDHMIAVVEDSTDRFWIVGDADGIDRPLSTLTWRPLWLSAVDGSQSWRKLY